MYTLIEHTPLKIFGILTLISAIYLTYFVQKKVRGILIFKVVAVLLFFSIPVITFVMEIFPDTGFFMLKYILPPLGIMYVLLGYYNKILLRREKEKTIW